MSKVNFLVSLQQLLSKSIELQNSLIMKNFSFNFYEVLQSVFSPSKHEYLLEAIKNSRLPDPCRVLDIGCGSGQDAPLFKNKKHFDYLGIEITESSVTRATKRFPELRFRLENLVEKPLVSPPFDLILIDCVFHHLPDGKVQLLIERACDKLAPDGIILIQDMVYPPKGKKFAFIQNMLIAMDRGKYCRQHKELIEIVGSEIDIVEEKNYQMLTYDMCLLKCISKRVES